MHIWNCCHGRGALDPAVALFAPATPGTFKVELQTQTLPATPGTLVRRAEVVEAANQVHALFEQFRCAHQGATAPCQAGQALAEGGVEPFDIGRHFVVLREVDAAAPLTLTKDAPDRRLAALSDATFDSENTLYLCAS